MTILDVAALEELLRRFEDDLFTRRGIRMSSAEFYDLYRLGRAPETPKAMEWATYYELLRRSGEDALSRAGVVHSPFVSA